MTKRVARTTRRGRPTRGVAMMFALIAVIVVTMMGAALIRAMMLDVRQSRVDEWAVQADWLVEAAANRAAARLAGDAEYTGETWAIDASRLDGRHAAEVVILAIAPQPGVRSVAITARYPADATIFVTREKTYTVGLARKTSNDTETPTEEDAP